jgi:tetratricopeptide (TPR) repeat protein
MFRRVSNAIRNVIAPAMTRRGWRRHLFNLFAGLLVATLFLVVSEVGLRLLPLDRWEEGLPNNSYPLFIPGAGEYADQYVTNPHFAKTMSIQHFARHKPKGTKRIFILGGSAALGWPGPIPTAFSSYMQRALDQGAPGKFEIVNVAAMSYGSHRVLDLLGDLVDMEPDLVVVWSGNNEYIERNAFSAFGRTAGMRRLQRVLRYSYLYRTLRLGLGSMAPSLFARPEGGDITDPRNAPQVRRGMIGRSPAADLQVLQNYEANLAEMARLIRGSGGAGIFCTVPVNLSGWVPASAAPGIDDPVRAQQWTDAMEQVIDDWDQKNYGAAAAGLERLLVVTPQHAFTHYLLGDCYRHLGRWQGARAEYSKARDFDPRPIRALSSFEQTVRDVAARSGMTLVDLEGAFAAASPSGVPGLDLFLDYVHPNEAGHKLAAREVLQGVVALLAPSLSRSQLSQFIAEDDWIARHDFNKGDMLYALGMTLYNNGDLAGAEQAYLRALQIDPTLPEAAGNLGLIYAERGDLKAAREYYQRAVRLDPGISHTINLAQVLFRLGDYQGAREMGERSLQQGTPDMKFFVLLGDIEVADGRLPQALERYLQAATGGDSSPELQVKIGDLYRQMGDEAHAQAAYGRAAAIR